MKLAVLSDLHANLDALTATLAAVKKQGADEVAVLGDFVGYYYAPSEVLAALKSLQIKAIRGNHERMLEASEDDAKLRADCLAKYGSGLEVARATLSADDRAWLRALPDRRELAIDGLRLELCHGSPRDADEYVYPTTDAPTIDAMKVDDRDFVFAGHTHYPMLAFGKGVTFVNPGSVGQARDVGGLASWCLLDTGSRVLTFHKTPYDPGRTRREAATRDPAVPYLADVLVRNNPLAREARS